MLLKTHTEKTFKMLVVCKSVKVCLLILIVFISAENFNFVESHAVSSLFTKFHGFKVEGDIIQTIAVQNIFQCCWRCERRPSCLSMNIAVQLGTDGRYECQMLTNWTANKYSGLMKESKDYHHYTRLTVSHTRL